jgi:hypothetical protein
MGNVDDARRGRFRELPLKRRLSFAAGLVVGFIGIMVCIVGLVRIHDWNATVTHEDCSVNAVNGPELYGKSQHQWLVHTVDCGVLAITVGNPGYPFSGGQKLATELSSPAAYHLTLHGWGSRKDIVAAAPVSPVAIPTTAP